MENWKAWIEGLRWWKLDWELKKAADELSLDIEVIEERGWIRSLMKFKCKNCDTIII